MAEVAVLLHLATPGLLKELLRDIQNVQKAGVSFDLFVNLVEGKVEIAPATTAIRALFPTATIVTSENRGMDIGGFLTLLPLVYQGNYTYLLKLHSKNTMWWRRALISPLCGHAYSVNNCLMKLRQHPKIGMLGAAQHLLFEKQGQKPNYYYLEKLTTRLGLPLTHFSFIGGTMFWARVAIFRGVLTPELCPVLCKDLNTPTTLDPYWYFLNYRDREVRSPEDAATHYEHKGKHLNRVRNCLEAREKKITRSIPDGMLEHAYERLFGLIAKSQGYLVASA